MMPQSSAAMTPEARRLSTLRDLVVLDSEPEQVFDSIARLASRVCGTPIALLSLVDEERQWFKANVGMPGVNETPRDVAFCDHAIRSSELFEVPDATQDPRFAHNPLVGGDGSIRFYAGAPLSVAGGARVGTLCVIDDQPRQLNAEQSDILQSLAAIATQALELRRDLIHKTLAVRTEYEKALSASEAQHRALVEQQSDLIGLCRPTGELVYANPAYARQFGRTPSEMVGTNLFDRVDPMDQAQVRERLEGAFHSGEAHSGENRLLTADGHTIWVAWTTRLQRDQNGQALLHSVGRDITDRKLAEEALHASQQFLYRTGQVAGVGGWELDLRSQRITWSEQTRRIHEVDDAYVPTLENAIQFFAPEARPEIEAALAQALHTGQPWDLELGFVTGSGRHAWVRVVGEVMHEHGEPARMVGAIQDVTQRKHLERQLSRQSATLRAVIESIPANLSIVDSERHVQYANSSFARWCGTTRDKLIGMPLAKVLGSTDYERSRPWIERVQAGETVSFEKAYPGRRDGAHMAITYVPLWDEQGQTDGFVQIAHDISQHRFEEGRLLQLSQRDPLTGLLNRSGFQSYMERQLAAGGGETLALLCIDLDRFKPVNDTHGHAAGDQLLKQFAMRLARLVRPSDAVARLGGDEFAVALANIQELRHACTVADKIIASASEPFDVEGLQLLIGASIGIAWGVPPGEPWAKLVAEADAMLYKAKGAGRGTRASAVD